MNSAVRAKLNNMLAANGLGRLDDPGLPVQLGYLVQDHEHFRALLAVAEPEHRQAMYNALSPNLRFTAKPLDVYISEAAADAARRQLPTIAADGTLHAYKDADVQTVQRIVEDAMAKGWLRLVCKKCTREETFSGLRQADAIYKARVAGWTYREELHDGEMFASEICPSCI